MGVKNLETYLKKKKLLRDFNMEMEAAKYRKKNKRDPVIVVDGANSLRGHLYGKSKNHPYDKYWILGGQMKEMTERVTQFVQAFKKIGVKIVFFFNGATSEENREQWLSRRQEHIKKVIQLFWNLSTGATYQRQYLLPPLVGSTARYATTFVGGCDIYISFNNDDYEMAEYARKNDCFAILSKDTDFIFHEGTSYYLSSEHLDLDDMTTKRYDIEGFKKSVGLDDGQEFLLLATLLGNDIVSHGKLIDFHKSLIKWTPKTQLDILKLLPALVNYIKEKKFPYDKEFGYLEDLAKDIFQDVNMANELQRSMEGYMPSTKEVHKDNCTPIEKHDRSWADILEKAKERHMKGVVTPHMYSVMLGNAYELAAALEPYIGHNSKFRFTAQIYQVMRERIYAILLKENSKIANVKEWCLTGKEVPNEPKILYPKMTEFLAKVHPGLLTLWNDECSPMTRWEVFAAALSAKRQVDARSLKELGLPLAVPVAVLIYLNEQNEHLPPGAEDAILAHTALMKLGLYTADQLKHMPVDLTNRFILRTFVIMSTIFHRGISTVLFLLSACGFSLEEAMPWLYFDGKLLFTKYIQWQQCKNFWYLCDGQESVHKTAMNMKRIISANHTEHWGTDFIPA